MVQPISRAPVGLLGLVEVDEVPGWVPHEGLVAGARKGQAGFAHRHTVGLDGRDCGVEVSDQYREVLAHGRKMAVFDAQVQLARAELEPCPFDGEVGSLDLEETKHVTVELPCGG